MRSYLHNWPQQLVTRRLCENIEEPEHNLPMLQGIFCLSHVPMKWKCNTCKLGGNFTPHTSQLMRWILEQLWGQPWQEDVEKLERIQETAVKITGWERSVL